MHDLDALNGPRIAILVDAENISADTWPALDRIFRGLGAGMSLSCYGDFTNPAHAGWLEVCRENNGTAVMVFRNGNGKNGADIALTIGAMELVQNAAAKMIVIVSSDSDFAPLAQKITTAGCIAIGVGRDSASEDLRQAFDRYIILPATGPTKTTTQIPKAAASPMPEPPQRTASPPPSAQPASQAESLLPEQVEFLSELLERLAHKDPSGGVLLSYLAQSLRKEYPTLGEKLAKGQLRKALQHYGLAEEQGSGTSIKVSPRRAARRRVA